jgi:hypothetical protein
MGTGGTTPPILNIGIKWKSVVSLTHWLLYPEERVPVPVEWTDGWVPQPYDVL